MEDNKQQGVPVWGWQGQLGTIAECARHILDKDILSDVTFRVGPSNGETVDIKAHRFLLALRSTVFEAMFYGSLAETKNVICITDIDEKTFRMLLSYIYHDEIGPFDDTTALSALYAAKKYGIPILKTACENYVKTHVTVDNCLAWFVQAKMYDEPSLADFCMEKVDYWAVAVLQSTDFLEIDLDTLRQILSRDTLIIKEQDVYQAAVAWAKNRCNNKGGKPSRALRFALRNVLFLIRFPIMTPKEIAAGPAKLGLLADKEVNQLFQFWYNDEELPEYFINKKRKSLTVVSISRFGGGLLSGGWPYRPGFPDVIGFSVASIMDKENHPVVPVSVSLGGFGLYVQNPLPAGVDCTVLIKIYEGYEDTSTAVTQERELIDFQQSLVIPAGSTPVQQLKLNKAVPLNLQQNYVISAQITGMSQSAYAKDGKANVTASAGDLAITAKFWTVKNPELPANTSSDVSQGQFPELLFEIVL